MRKLFMVFVAVFCFGLWAVNATGQVGQVEDGVDVEIEIISPMQFEIIEDLLTFGIEPDATGIFTQSFNLRVAFEGTGTSVNLYIAGGYTDNPPHPKWDDLIDAAGVSVQFVTGGPGWIPGVIPVTSYSAVTVSDPLIGDIACPTVGDNIAEFDLRIDADVLIGLPDVIAGSVYAGAIGILAVLQ